MFLAAIICPSLLMFDVLFLILISPASEMIFDFTDELDNPLVLIIISPAFDKTFKVFIKSFATVISTPLLSELSP